MAQHGLVGEARTAAARGRDTGRAASATDVLGWAATAAVPRPKRRGALARGLGQAISGLLASWARPVGPASARGERRRGAAAGWAKN